MNNFMFDHKGVQIPELESKEKKSTFTSDLQIHR